MRAVILTSKSAFVARLFFPFDCFASFCRPKNTCIRIPLKMKKLAGKSLSAFFEYSNKRKTSDKLALKKKNDKKRMRLSDILPDKPSAALLHKATVGDSAIIKKTQKKNGNSSKNNAGGKVVAGNFNVTEMTKRGKGKKTTAKRLRAMVHTSPKKLEHDETQASPKMTNGSPTKSKIHPTITNGDKTRETPSLHSSDGEFQETIHRSLCNDPMEDGKSLFQWLIHPLSIEDFFKSNWESAPLYIKRSKANYYKLLMSTPMLDKILRDFHILYTKNIDITSYSNGQRETHNPTGRARPSVVWDYYSNGCSVRMLNPQTFIPKLHALNATLQEFFGCFVGANSYLTPPDSQGFAPHYDDIEAFIIQVEGKKRWRLYKPLTEGEYLPRYSSRNFDPSEIGEPVLDKIVSAGDLLYFPRGTIHQGETIDGTHSLHITLSVYQKNSWCDYLEKLLPEALKTAAATDSRFREGLPLNYLKHVGCVNANEVSQERQNFIAKTKELLHRLIDNIDVDKVADQMAKGNIHDFLPPVLSPQEQECSAVEDGERMTTAGLVETRVEIEPDTRIRLLRSHCVRLVEEEDCVRIYYSTENSKEYHEYEPQYLEVDKEFAPAVKEIIKRYPDFVKVDDLPIEGEDNRVQVAKDLWEKCIVVTDVPLPIVE